MPRRIRLDRVVARWLSRERRRKVLTVKRSSMADISGQMKSKCKSFGPLSPRKAASKKLMKRHTRESLPASEVRKLAGSSKIINRGKARLNASAKTTFWE